MKHDGYNPLLRIFQLPSCKTYGEGDDDTLVLMNDITLAANCCIYAWDGVHICISRR